ncbi:hypothetical protein ACP3WI_25235, partial [Salmonella enterica]|uniref:hypothetical protein n=1 Tax=Salmonella enterica TaxID=28901 RepID=UPI003CFA2937
DKTMLSTVYAEVVKNLELAKFTLSQETPVIQIVDNSLFPLIRNKVSKIFQATIFFYNFLFFNDILFGI